MALKLIPQAVAYKMVLPESADALAAHLKPFEFKEIKAHEARSIGFTEVQGELVFPFPGGYAFALRIDAKVVPGSLVKAEVARAADFFEECEGYRPGRKVMREFKERVIGELTAKALTSTKTVYALYHLASQTLIVPNTSERVRGDLTGLLLRAVESIKVTTIYLSSAKASLTNRLELTLNGFDDQFGEFQSGNKVVLVGPNGKSAFDLAGDLDNASAGVREAIAGGALVKEIALSKGDTLHFRLTQDFALKGITFGESEPEEGYDDQRTAFEMEAAKQTTEVVALVDDLCALFGYTPKFEGEEA